MSYSDQLTQKRLQKDRFFFSGHPQSPIAPADISKGHLLYWEPDEVHIYRCEGRHSTSLIGLHRYRGNSASS